MLKKILCVAALLITAPWNTASAVVSSGSNMDTFEYPSPACSKPPKPARLFKPHTNVNEWEVEQYNSEIRNYNAKFEKYADCIKKYVDNAKNDMERIRQKANEAIADAEK